MLKKPTTHSCTLCSRFVVERDDVDVEVAGSGGETGDGLDVGSECISDDLISKNWERVMREKILQVTGTSGHADISNGDNKA
jgi:hypothetical protein